MSKHSKAASPFTMKPYLLTLATVAVAVASQNTYSKQKQTVIYPDLVNAGDVNPEEYFFRNPVVSTNDNRMRHVKRSVPLATSRPLSPEEKRLIIINRYYYPIPGSQYGRPGSLSLTVPSYHFRPDTPSTYPRKENYVPETPPVQNEGHYSGGNSNPSFPSSPSSYEIEYGDGGYARYGGHYNPENSNNNNYNRKPRPSDPSPDSDTPNRPMLLPRPLPPIQQHRRRVNPWNSLPTSSMEDIGSVSDTPSNSDLGQESDTSLQDINFFDVL